MSTNGHHDSDGRSTVAPALLLWILVACGLLYGIVETVSKVPALFGG
jgi:hypothetical protein